MGFKSAADAFILKFLKQVSTLFESSAKSGSIWLTHKRRTCLYKVRSIALYLLSI